jgi:hypothetical protein
MNTPTPTPETPSRAMVREVAGHPLQRRGILAVLLSMAAGLPALLSGFHTVPGLHLPGWLEATLGAIAVLAMWAAPFLNSLDSADQAARAAVRGPQDVLVVPEDGGQDLFPPGTVPPGGRLS